MIVAQMLTDATVDDAMTGIGMIEAIDADLARVTATRLTTRSHSTKRPRHGARPS